MQGGCGGAAIAGYEGEAWVWAALGFGALGFAMRRRATRSSALSLTALSALVVFVGASNPAPSVSDGVAFFGADGSVPMTVQSSDSSWEGGVIVTRLGLRGTDGANVTHEVTVKTLGGQVGELVQVVGHVLPPQIGDSLRIRLGTGVKGETIWVAPHTDRH
jgi:hypothetical protein